MPRGVPATGKRKPSTNATYRLDANERVVLGIMAATGLWSYTRLATEFKVSRKTVYDCRARWEGTD